MLRGEYETRGRCRGCEDTFLVPVINLGVMPLAGTFLTKKELDKEKYYPLKLYRCNSCGLVQLLDIVPKKELFQSYLSSVSMSGHFLELAEELNWKFLKKGDFVVEIGSNDGVLLAPLKIMGMKVLGIEPMEKIAKIARERGIKTINDFFSYRVADKIKQKADMVVACNVFAHIDNIDDVMRGVKRILKEDGVFVIEVHYLLDMINDLQYPNIYHEHLSYYSVASLSTFLEKWGFEIIEVKRISSHCGSIRVYAKQFPFKKLMNYQKEINKNRDDLVGLLKKLKKQGKKIIGYGASGKGNTLLNYCGIGPEYLTYILDESPLRNGRYTPGTHIPVEKPVFVNFIAEDVDYILILAWNYEKQIRDKLKGFKGKFIIPLPKVKII